MINQEHYDKIREGAVAWNRWRRGRLHIKPDLRGTDLRRTDLNGVDLCGADLRMTALPSPTVVLLAVWGNVTDDLCLDLMRYDASCHPDPIKFDLWAEGGICPYSYAVAERAARFTERRELYTPGPSRRPWDLMVDVIREKCADSDFHDHKKEG